MKLLRNITKTVRTVSIKNINLPIGDIRKRVEFFAEGAYLLKSHKGYIIVSDTNRTIERTKRNNNDVIRYSFSQSKKKKILDIRSNRTAWLETNSLKEKRYNSYADFIEAIAFTIFRENKPVYVALIEKDSKEVIKEYYSKDYN